MSVNLSSATGDPVAVVSWKSIRKVLMRHVRFVPQLGEKARLINVAAAILIPPFGGSSPPAPASKLRLGPVT
jgi:hypothetical protein